MNGLNSIPEDFSLMNISRSPLHMSAHLDLMKLAQQPLIWIEHGACRSRRSLAVCWSQSAFGICRLEWRSCGSHSKGNAPSVLLPLFLSWVRGPSLGQNQLPAGQRRTFKINNHWFPSETWNNVDVISVCVFCFGLHYIPCYVHQ